MTYDRNALHTIAREAGIKVPVLPSQESWDMHGHFELFVAMQRYAKAPNKEALFANAKLIASLDRDQIDTITKNQLLKMGFIEG